MGAKDHLKKFIELIERALIEFFVTVGLTQELFFIELLYYFMATACQLHQYSRHNIHVLNAEQAGSISREFRSAVPFVECQKQRPSDQLTDPECHIADHLRSEL